MASINFNEIYSRFFSKVEAFDFLYEEASAGAYVRMDSRYPLPPTYSKTV